MIEGKLQTRDFTKPWASATPRVAFLGDAAHPLRPTGEGTALALEDAWTLGSLAVAAESTDDFCDPATIRQYEALRGARVEAVSNAVRISANRFYAKGEGKTSGDEDLKTPDGSVDQAFKAHPLVCKPL
jgi:2-polyprenyl-6-methoxyphenol hydroxylase-like FAD-dependent oxidoreductase